MTNDMTTALVIVMGINVMMFLGQAAILSINPEGPTFYHCEGTVLGELDQGKCATTGSYVLDSTDPANRLPSGETSVSPETGNIFTDAFTASKSWLLDTLGLSYITALLAAPASFLYAFGLPGAFSFAVGAMWYAVSLFILVSWIIRGGSG